MAVTTTTVGTSSTPIIGASPSGLGTRRKLTFVNPNLAGGQRIALVQAPGVAVVDGGLGLVPGEKVDVFGDDALTAWNGIGSGAGAKVTIIEYLFAPSAMAAAGAINLNLTAG
jgi:hypothetical protein